MLTYEEALDTLDRELQGVADTFADLSDDEWRAPTLLEPFEPDRPHWTVFELAGHLTISIGLTSMLIADQQDGQPGRDQVSFFIFPRSEVAPAVYDYAYTMVEGKTPSDMPGVLRETFSNGGQRVTGAATRHGRVRVLRPHAPGRVRVEPDRRGRRTRHGPDRRHWASLHCDAGGRCLHGRTLRRAAGQAHRGWPPDGPRRRLRLGARGIGPDGSS